MMTVRELGEASEREDVRGVYLVVSLQERGDKNGKPFLALSLCDKTGTIEARMWSTSASSVAVEQGQVAEITGTVESYQGRKQLTLRSLSRTLQASPADFLPATTKDVEQMWRRLLAIIDGFNDPDLKALLSSIVANPAIASALREAPAAKQLHHAWIGGLLEHVVSLLGLAEAVTAHYTDLNRDLIYTGVILHDIGKLKELGWRRGCFEYTLEGQLLGHIQMGYTLADHYMAKLPNFPPRLRLLVLHLILSHHGKLEFGSPKLPMFPEAVVLSFLDDLDAKMQAMRSELEKSESRKPDELTDRIWSLDNRQILDTAKYLKDSKE